MATRQYPPLQGTLTTLEVMFAQLLGMPMHQSAKFSENHFPMTTLQLLYPFDLANKSWVVPMEVA